MSAMFDRLRGVFGGGAKGGPERGADPASWAFALFLFFGAAQIIAGAVYFFAYNWRDLPDGVKILLPQAVMALSFLVYALAPARSAAGTAAAILATVMIGVAMGVVGQVYQQGADPWRLFAIWAAFALPLSLLARSDAHFATFFLIATTAYGLWTDEVLRPKFENVQIVPATYAGLAFLVLLARETAGGMPRWQRWMFAFFALAAAAGAGISEIDDATLFRDGYAGSIALFALAAAMLGYYLAVRPERPTRTLALFAVALWVGVFGVRAVFRMDLNGPTEFAFAFVASAVWVIAVTAGFASLARGKKT